jgi:hypothetical protein
MQKGTNHVTRTTILKSIARLFMQLFFLRKSIILCCILFFSNSLVFSQLVWVPGYIITQKSDTIHGFIEFRETKSLNRVCHFKENQEAEVQIFAPGDIAGYRFSSGRYFVSRFVDDLDIDQPVFLEFLVKGEVSFFHFLDTISQYFVLKEGEFHELKNTKKMISENYRKFRFERKEYIGALNYILGDADMKKDIDRAELTSKSLINLAIEYQAQVCPDEDCIVYEIKKPPIRATLGLQTGLVGNNISFGGRLNSNFSPGFYAGLLLRFENVIQWSENLILESQINLQQFTYYSLSAGTKGNWLFEQISYKDEIIILSKRTLPHSARVNLNTTALKVPLTLLYLFPRHVHTPYLGIGLSTMFVLNQPADLTYSFFDYHLNKTIPSFHFGPRIAAGTTLKLKSFKGLSMGVSYEHTESANINQMLRFISNQFSFDVAFHF